jgi:hypothetical protein
MACNWELIGLDRMKEWETHCFDFDAADRTKLLLYVFFA